MVVYAGNHYFIFCCSQVGYFPLTLCTPRAHLCARGDFERLAFKYLYTLEKDGTAIWCSRQCACVLMRTSVVRIQKEKLFFFLSSILVFLTH